MLSNVIGEAVVSCWSIEKLLHGEYSHIDKLHLFCFKIVLWMYWFLNFQNVIKLRKNKQTKNAFKKKTHLLVSHFGIIKLDAMIMVFVFNLFQTV